MAAKYTIGQVIHHRRYGYRGVVVSFDDQCEADGAWYQKNQTQPRRDQPWYHVLVDDSEQTTYVAEENLETDVTGRPVRHPLLHKVFRSFFDGRYSHEILN